MSGGSWDYVYARLQDVAIRLASSSSYDRRALGVLVDRVAQAMREIEWEDSGDGGQEAEAIREALGTARFPLVAQLLRNDLDRIVAEATKLLGEVKP